MRERLILRVILWEILILSGKWPYGITLTIRTKKLLKDFITTGFHWGKQEEGGASIYVTTPIQAICDSWEIVGYQSWNNTFSLENIDNSENLL